jgi:hypothetical protein
MLAVNTTGLLASFGNNPFTRSPTRIQSPALGQIPEQLQQNFYSTPPQQPQTSNPFLSQQMSPPQGGTQALQNFQLPQTTMQPQRPDKASIMALYSYPQLAPRPFIPQDEMPGPARLSPGFSPQPTPADLRQATSVSSPAPGSKNPFLGNGSSQVDIAPQQPTLSNIGPGKYHASRDSIMAHGLDWSNGRHSPDAFTSLSARDVR